MSVHPDVRVAAATLTVTPDHEVILGASARPELKSIGTSEPIEANIAVVQAHDDLEPVVLVSLDLLYPGRLLRAALEAALAPLHPSRLLLFASHSHRGPMTDDTKPRLGEVDSDYVTRLIADVAGTCERLIGGVTAGERCELAVATCTADHSVNRRLMTSRGVLGAPNDSGPRDETITILVARNADGDPRFVFWNYACHPVAFPEPRMVSAHFPHVVRQRLRETWRHPSLPVLYLQGFSGDTRPSASGVPQTIRQRARGLLVGPRFHDLSWVGYAAWTGSLSNLVATTALTARPIQSTTEIRAVRRTRPASDFVLSNEVIDAVSFHALGIGTQLTLLGVSAEVVSQFALELRAENPDGALMLGGCLDHPFGYVPTSSMLAEGGYEAKGFCPFFGLTGVRSDIAESIKTELADIGNDVARQKEGRS